MARKRLKKKKATISGLVTPTEWDDSDQASRVNIVTDDEEVFEVYDDDTGQQLLDYLFETVRAFGFKERDSDGGWVLHVADFQPQD